MATEQENNDQISDSEMFDQAFEDEPKVEKEPEAKPEPEETKEAKAERERDDKGRFKSKETDEEPAAEIEAQPEPEPKQEPERQDQIPSWRLKEEADARREWQQRAEAEAQQRQALQNQLWQLQQQLQSQQKPEEPVDIFADPQNWEQSFQQKLDQRMREQEGNFSLRLAKYKHGETFDQAWQAMVDRTQSGDDSIRQHVIGSPDPGETLVNWYKRESVISQVGDDPTAYRSKVLEDALKDPEFLAKALEAAKATAQQKPETKVQLPPSLNKATSSAPSGHSTGVSDSDMFEHATR